MFQPPFLQSQIWLKLLTDSHMRLEICNLSKPTIHSKNCGFWILAGTENVKKPTIPAGWMQNVVQVVICMLIIMKSQNKKIIISALMCLTVTV